MDSNSFCSHLSDFQSDLLIISVITDLIGWHEVLLPINEKYEKKLRDKQTVGYTSACKTTATSRWNEWQQRPMHSRHRLSNYRHDAYTVLFLVLGSGW